MKERGRKSEGRTGNSYPGVRSSGKNNPKTKKSVSCIFYLMIVLIIFVACQLTPVNIVSAEEIKSRGAVVMDAVTGRVLYAKNPGLRLMPASTTKLMTALVVIEKANLSDIVTVSRRAANSPPTKIGLKAGEKVTIETLLNAALIKSANDAAVALAEAVAGSEQKFVNLMNRKALALGINDTRFINSNGLPGKGQYITAYDLAKIMRHAIKYPLLKDILGTRVAEVTTETGKTIFVKNTNHLLWSDEELLGGKTGYTRQARHCFVSAAERDSGTVIVALLGTPSRDLLWKETEDLIAFGSRVINNLEEPVVYITKSDYDAEKVTNASYTKKTKYKSSIKKHKKKKISRSVSSKKKMIKAKKAVKNGKVAGTAKNSKTENKPSVANKAEDGNKG
ncbi:MAG: D-alanyl-D-alanine carboxypeptidase family protein [Nitrospirota bacterium]